MTKYSLPYPLPLKNPHSPFRNFNYIRPIRIIGTDEDLKNYQVKIVLTKYNFPLEKCKSDGSDIRFRDETGKILPYWIESWNSDEAVIWCKVPFIPARKATDIWIIYGNPLARSASDGSATFDFYDDFSSSFIREWTPYSGNPVLSPEGDEGLTSWGSVWKDGDTYHMFYSYSDSGNGRKIGHATSSDGKNWTKDTDHNPILMPSGSGWDDGKVWDPAVWKEGSTWYMLYTGRDSAATADAIGLATASDPSGPWTKDSSNPVLEGTSGEWDANTVENMNLMKIGSTYYLWYNTLLGVGSDRKTGLATSTDLINWTKDSNNPIFGQSGGYFQPCPFKYGSYYYLLIMHYTSGSDYSEIQLYRDTNPTFYSGEREFVKVVKSCSASGWDSHDQDTPCVLTDDIYRNSFPNDELWTYYAGESGGTWRTGLLIETDIDAALGQGVFNFEVEGEGSFKITDSTYLDTSGIGSGTYWHGPRGSYSFSDSLGNFEMRAKIKQTVSTSGLEREGVYLCDDSGNIVYFFYLGDLWASNAHSGVRLYKDGGTDYGGNPPSGSTLLFNSGEVSTWNDGEWVFKLSRLGSNLHLSYDNNDLWSGDSGTSTLLGMIKFAIQGYSDKPEITTHMFDCIMVRKYASTEPLVIV